MACCARPWIREKRKACCLLAVGLEDSRPVRRNHYYCAVAWLGLVLPEIDCTAEAQLGLKEYIPIIQSINTQYVDIDFCVVLCLYSTIVYSA